MRRMDLAAWPSGGALMGFAAAVARWPFALVGATVLLILQRPLSLHMHQRSLSSGKEVAYSGLKLKYKTLVLLGLSLRCGRCCRCLAAGISQ